MIGILDSGLGGLSVLNEIRKVLPHKSLSYFGDSAWCPYGNKTYPEIQERVSKIVELFISEGAEIIVIACNSATIACVEYLRTIYPIPIVGMEPGVKPAVKATKTGNIGVFATEASLAGEKFHRLLSTHAKGVRVITRPCPKFVTLVEEGKLSGKEVEEVIHEYTAPLVAEKIDTLVLGCTHYPFLKETISQLYPDLKIIDTGRAVADQVSRKLLNVTENQSISCVLRTSNNEKKATNLLPKLCPSMQNLAFIKHLI